MQKKTYKLPVATGSGGFDASGFWFAAGLVIVAIIATVLSLALGISPEPDMSMLQP